jgi:hypothetical protein
VTPPHFFADLYTFDWSEAHALLPMISSLGVAVCVFAGIVAGHPGAGLIAGGSAFTVGFGANQRIADSRIWPMIAATFATALSTFVGMLAGHHGFTLFFAAAAWGIVYALQTARATGISWVGQQATVFLLVASAFPTNLHGVLVRSSLTLAGGAIQIVITSAGMRLLPQLGQDLLHLSGSLYHSIADRRRETMLRLRDLPFALPALRIDQTLVYALRMAVTLMAGVELYRRLGVQSGYWIPMTALLVQKPRFFETVTRTAARIFGTLSGAVLASIFVTHAQPSTLWLAVLVTLAAFFAYVTNSVNYALFVAFLSAYIVFLLSLNQLPGPEIAHRRAYCTIAGGLIAIVLHLDSLFRRRSAE